MDTFTVRTAGPGARVCSVTSDTPLKYMSRKKATYVKNTRQTVKREETTATKNDVFLVSEQCCS